MEWEFGNVGLRGRWENYRHSWREDKNQNLTECPNDVDTKRRSLNGMKILLKINAITYKVKTVTSVQE